MTTKTAVRVRMYNVGFGDCFLVFIPAEAGSLTMLVDCGFHMHGKGRFTNKQMAERVIADLKEETGRARIDVLVATHRHRDHIWGFCEDAWDAVEVGEVWMPWVDDPENPEAAGLWKKTQKFAMNLAAALPGFALGAADQKEVDFLLWNAGFDAQGGGELLGVQSNDVALSRLRDGLPKRKRDTPRYLPSAEAYPQRLTTKALPGVAVHVLGPPRDPDLLAELDPERDGESYRTLALRAAAAGGALPDGLVPFGPAWRIGKVDAAKLDAAKGGAARGGLAEDEVARVDDLAHNGDALMAARKLDNMINATSLVFVLEVGNARLLFPGDAEWGTWKRILAAPKARALLRGTTFLKVGHHGSHNATPKTFVEDVLPRKVPAFVSTQEGEGSYRNDIPLPAMIAALEAHGARVVRSDEPPARLSKGFKAAEDEGWIEVSVPC